MRRVCDGFHDRRRAPASIEGPIDSNNNRFNSNALYVHALLYRVGRSPTRDLQLEQLHRGESLTSFDRETGPVSIARKLREIYEQRIRPASKFYVTFHHAKQPILCTSFYFPISIILFSSRPASV